MPPGSPWRGSLRDLTQIVNDIRRLRAFGRLTLRSTTHIGLAHLFFRGGKLVHIVSNSGDATATLADLRRWTRAVVHFERGIPLGKQNVNREHEQIFENLLGHLQKRSVAAVSENPRVMPASESPRMFSMPESPRAASISANPRAAPASGSELFFFQAEDGIRGGRVTGVQTCALPISAGSNARMTRPMNRGRKRTGVIRD